MKLRAFPERKHVLMTAAAVFFFMAFTGSASVSAEVSAAGSDQGGLTAQLAPVKKDKVSGTRHGCLIDREPDADGDGTPDVRDAFPDDPTRWRSDEAIGGN